MAKLSTWELEKYLSPDLWHKRSSLPFPELIHQQLEEDLRTGYPVAIGRHPEIGLFVIESGGQGPYLIYQEKE